MDCVKYGDVQVSTNPPKMTLRLQR